MLPILTLTPNPAVDVSTSASEVVAGPKLRCDVPRFDAGGGGVNVSRAIRFLGGESIALIAAGGPNGDRLKRLLQDENVTFAAIELPGETRSSLSVTDRAGGGQYRFILPGPVWAEPEISAFETLLATRLDKGAIVVLSGSLPPGVPASWPASLSVRAAEAGAFLIVDTSGAPLRHLASAGAGVGLLRMDDGEADDLAGEKLNDAGRTADFAGALIAKGAAQAVVIARGAEGSILVTATQSVIARCPIKTVASAVGAGDSFVAGLAFALSRGEGLAEALRHGTAAAAAAVLTEATELCRPEDYRRLLDVTLMEQTGAPAAPAS